MKRLGYALLMLAAWYGGAGLVAQWLEQAPYKSPTPVQIRAGLPAYAMSGTPPESLLERTKRHEGLRLCPYKDSRGFYTQGYGHKLADGPYQCWTREFALTVLHDDLRNATAWAREDVGDGWAWQRMGEVRRGVLTEIAFQTGEHGLAGFHDMLAAIRRGDYDAAADALQDSRLHDEAPARTEELARLLR